MLCAYISQFIPFFFFFLELRIEMSLSIIFVLKLKDGYNSFSDLLFIWVNPAQFILLFISYYKILILVYDIIKEWLHLFCLVRSYDFNTFHIK